MAMGFECLSLLCAEDCSIVNEFEEEVNKPEELLFRDVAEMVTADEENRIAVMFEKEMQFMARNSYLMKIQSGAIDVSARNESIVWIYKVHGHYNFRPLTACLSVNYLDRFLSEYQLPHGKAWMVQLVSVSCVSLAAKMEETDVPLALDLQVGETKFIFEARTIQRMELLLLSTLKWRTNAVTPLSFIDYFLNRIKPRSPQLKSLIFRTEQIILSTTRAIEFLEFKPSEIALAAAISAIGETVTIDFDAAVDSCSSHFNKASVFECYELIQKILMMDFRIKTGSGLLSVCVPSSPVSVLDAAACLSNDSSKISDWSSSVSLNGGLPFDSATKIGVAEKNQRKKKRRKLKGFFGEI